MKRSRIAGQLKYLRTLTGEIPGAPSLPVAMARLAVWRIRCTAHKGTFVPAWGSATKIYCPPEWRGNAKLSYVMRGAIEPDLAIAVALVEPGALVVDVGAHYGSFTLPLAQAVGAAGTVIALEPNPAARSVLERGVEVNGLTNVSVLPFAISDTKGSALLHLEADPSRSSLMAQPVGTSVTMVELRRLDDVLADRTQPVRLMKVDVEGYESQVFVGATNTIEKDRPIIMFEDLLALRASEPDRQPVEFIRARGYQLREFWQGAWHDVAGIEHRAKNLWAFPTAVGKPTGSTHQDVVGEANEP